MIPLSGWLGLAAAGAAFFAGWTVRDWKADSDALRAADEAQARYVALSEENQRQSLAYEELAQDLRASERADRVTIREIYNEVEVPGECAVPDDAARLLDNAIRAANAAATGQPVGELPKDTPAPKPAD